MKKLFLLALSILLVNPILQAKDKEEKEEVKTVLVKSETSDEYYYEGVVPVDGISKEEMFKRAKNWVLSKFKTGDNNIQFDEQNMVIFNSPTIIIEKFRNNPGDFLNFKLRLQFKEGKYKFRFDNLIVKSNIFFNDPPKPYNGIKMYPGGKYNQWVIDQSNKALLSLALDLENIIKGNDKDNNW